MSADTRGLLNRADEVRPKARSRLLTSPPPSVAVEIARDRVGAVAVSDSGGGTVISGYAFDPLPAGIVEPCLNANNVLDAAKLSAAIKAALEKVTARAARIALVLPDTVTKVSLLRFEKVSAKVQDLDQLIRWQIRKAVPFRVEDAQVSWVPGVALAGGGREFLVTIARRDIIEGYERACLAAGVHAGTVDLATFNLINAGIADRDAVEGDWLLVHLATDYVTLAVVRGHDLVFFRNRSAAGESELTDLVHQTAMYHEDRLGGGGFSRVVLAGASIHGPDLAERLRQAIGDRLGVRVDSMDFRGSAAFADRISVNAALLDAVAPAVGVLLRDRGGRHQATRPSGQVA